MSHGRLNRVGSAANVTVYNDAILPLVDEAENSYFGFNVGGYTRGGEPLENFRLRRTGQETRDPAFPEHYETLDAVATYGGMIDWHFGHFMIETLSRQWWLKTVKNGPIVWHRQIPEELHPWQVEIFGLCGLDTDMFTYVSEALIVKEIAVPEVSVVLDDHFLPQWSDGLDVFQFRDPQAGKRVWFSRSQLPDHFGHVVEEQAIEEKLEDLGWTFVHPHAMSNTDLLEYIADAETISGFAASAYFVLLMAKDCQAKIKMVDRGGMGIPPVFEHYAEAKKLKQEILRPQLEHVSGEGATGTFRLESIDGVIDFVNG